jgi:copper(I)-binding protein
MTNLKTLALAAVLSLVATAAQAHSHKFKKLEIVHPWCFETEDTTKPVVVSMTISNAGGRPDKLLSVATALAAKAELRQGGTAAAPGPALRSITVRGHDTVNLKADGPHVVLTGIAKPLGASDSFVMTLAFERAGKVEVEVVVEEKSALAPAQH